MQYYWCSIILFSSFPKFHRVVPLLQTCSTIWVCIWSCLFLCMFIFGSIFHIWEKTCSFCISEPGLLHLTRHLPSNHIIIPYGWVILHCVYIPHFLIHSSVVGHLGCFQSLAIVNSAVMNMVCRCLCCILSYIPWVEAQERYHWIIWQFYL
jgi:hypothetical protein